MNELVEMSARDLAERIRRRELSPVEAVNAVLDRVSKIDPLVHAMVTVDERGALEAARLAEEALRTSATVGPLHGVPITVKDLVATQGLRTTLGSLALRDRVPDVDAPAVSLLREAGAIIIGKTTTPEFGHKAVTDSLLGEPTANPWNLDMTAGGSSGGAGAAVASGMGPIAVGTDGGGSIRVPAALCGVVGIKPTTGSVPTYPPSLIGALGHTGPMARTVADTALALAVMQGAGDRAHELTRLVERAADDGLDGVRIGLFRSVNDVPVEAEILEAVDGAAASAESRGAVVEPVTLPCEGFEEIWDVLFERGMVAQAALLPAGADAPLSPSLSTLLARARRGATGQAELADARRTQLAQRMAMLFDRYDLLLGPTVSVAAFSLGLDGPTTIAGSSVDEHAWWRLTQIWNLCGQPACSIPYGFTRTGLPIGVQLVAHKGRDQKLLRYAAALEEPVESPCVAILEPVSDGPEGRSSWE